MTPATAHTQHPTTPPTLSSLHYTFRTIHPPRFFNAHALLTIPSGTHRSCRFTAAATAPVRTSTLPSSSFSRPPPLPSSQWSTTPCPSVNPREQRQRRAGQLRMQQTIACPDSVLYGHHRKQYDVSPLPRFDTPYTQPGHHAEDASPAHLPSLLTLAPVLSRLTSLIPHPLCCFLVQSPITPITYHLTERSGGVFPPRWSAGAEGRRTCGRRMSSASSWTPSTRWTIGPKSPGRVHEVTPHSHSHTHTAHDHSVAVCS